MNGTFAGPAAAAASGASTSASGVLPRELCTTGSTPCPTTHTLHQGQPRNSVSSEGEQQAYTTDTTDRTLHTQHTAQTAHCTDSTLHRQHTAQTAHCTDSTLQRQHTAWTAHCTDSTLHRQHTAQTAHCTDSTHCVDSTLHRQRTYRSARPASDAVLARRGVLLQQCSQQGGLAQEGRLHLHLGPRPRVPIRRGWGHACG